jgi:type II secretory pathway pseudopilin PulG
MKSRRRAYTLVECLVVVILVAATLGTVTLTLHALYRADRHLRDALTHDRDLDRFIAQLRSDTHQAVSATVDEPPEETIAGAGLVLSFAGNQTIQYTIRSQHIERVVRGKDTVQHRETFPLPALSGWQVRAGGASPVVSLVLKLKPGSRPKQQTVARTCRVDAAVHLVRQR